MNFSKVVKRAQSSKWHLWLLNQGLSRTIPFNKPHGFRVEKITDTAVQTRLPYRRSNFNHIRGLHACALATISEFTSGFMLMTKLDPAKFRIILKTLEMEYHYQGKSDSIASFSADPEWLEEKIFRPLETSDAVVVICEVHTHDSENHHICTGKVHWQVKSWNKVRTKV